MKFYNSKLLLPGLITKPSDQFLKELTVSDFFFNSDVLSSVLRFELVFLFLLATTSSLFSQTTTTLQATDDNELFSNDNIRNYGSCNLSWIGPHSRMLMKFDLSSIPANATILSATLSATKLVSNSTREFIDARMMTSDWTEGTGTCDGNTGHSTWNSTTTNTGWNTAGGDFKLPNYDKQCIIKVTPGGFDYKCKSLNKIVFLSDFEITEAITQNYNEWLLTSFIFNIAPHKKILFNLLYQTILFNKAEDVNSLSPSMHMAAFIQTIHPLFFVKEIKEIVSNYNVLPMGGCFNAFGHDMIKFYNPDSEGYLHFIKIPKNSVI